LFHGKQVIKPEELEDLDTEESSILEHKEYAESMQASRDIIKIRKRSLVHPIEFVMLGKEAKNKAIEYAKDHHTDKSVVMTIASATNCKIDYDALEKKGDADMCAVRRKSRGDCYDGM